ncbi:hypothetical protein GCK32_002751, partial [Trichostrongylus colubriformis]
MQYIRVSVLKSWNSQQPMREIVRDDKGTSRRAEDTRSSRSKRSVGSGFISPSKNCNIPGYTGEFCEFPICIETNQNVPDVPQADGLGAPIDAAVLANCTQQYVVLVDETMYSITFFLGTDEPINPTFDLQGEDVASSRLLKEGKEVEVAKTQKVPKSFFEHISLNMFAGTIYFPDEIVEQSPEEYGGRFNLLPPGQYVVRPSADLATTYCQLSMRARTEMTLQGGFVLGRDYDVERSDYPNSRYTYYQQSAPVVVHVNRNRSPGSLNAISFVGENNVSLTKSQRNAKQFSLLSTVVADITWVEGISFQGYNFRRILPFDCIVDPSPTPVPTTPPAPTVPTRCQNGGVLINNLDSTAYCYCVGLFTGENCATRLCANGGE